MANKGVSRKKKLYDVYQDSSWKVNSGRLSPKPGRPHKTEHLFEVVAEKLPFESLATVEKTLVDAEMNTQGVYMAHDSMGVARYGGRGNIFSRLYSHKKRYPKELMYFSFYTIKNKSHEREIENAILRAAGGQMMLNQNKKREGLEVGAVTDYEAGTYFFERRPARRTKKKKKTRRQTE
ncbi:hypothetical protein [Bradyrhizobium diazoefficiens]